MIYLSDPDVVIHQGDVRDVLPTLEAESVDCVMTSPPFYALRDYGVEGQIGLEETPEQWVAELVTVFRECRRVLKDTGTLWVECGDSYAGSRCGPPGDGETGRHVVQTDAFVKSKREGKRWGGGDIAVPGLKAKDLLGTPWMLAFALRGPWYMGRIKNDIDRVWLAAMVDAEGCIHIHRRKAGTSSGAKFTRKDGTIANYERKSDTYGVMVGVSNTSREIVEKCKALYGLGSVSAHEAGTGKQQRKQTLYQWQVTGDQARDLLRELYPHLVAKQQQARLALACPTQAGQDYQDAIKALHAGATVDLDGKTPESMWEPGFYLRQCIVWGKPNAMPESAKDRCTTAHSYVFLLSKNPRYWSDFASIGEDFSPLTNSRGKGTGPKQAATEHGGTLGAGRVNGSFGAALRDLPHMQRVPQSETLDGSEGESPRGPDGRRATHVQKGEHSLQHRDGDRWPNDHRHPRSVWTIPTQGFPEAHFATWPEALCERIIKAGCPVGGMILDPFMGSGTTGLVARKLGRNCVGVELNPDYCEMAAKRLQQLSLLTGDAA